MAKRFVLCVLGSILFAALQASAQSPCPNTAISGKLICTIPQVFGFKGLTSPPFQTVGHDLHFNAEFQSSFTPLNSAVGTQLSLLQLASPASGITFTVDRSLGIVQQSNESFGPVLSERAETIGRHKLFVAVTYQYYKFSSIDGIDLRNLPVVFQHVDTPATGTGACVIGRRTDDPTKCIPVAPSLGSNGQPNFVNDGNPNFEREEVVSNNSIDLKVHQVTAFATFGLTKRIDVSVSIPFSNVRLGVFSNAQVVANDVVPGDPVAADYVHTFCANGPCLTDSFANVHTATGIGDVSFRVKGTVWKGERFGIALGADFRTPTGDENNFLGSGAFGFKPFIVASRRGRVSPHANVGFQWNGSSILAGNVSTGAEGRLPREFFYSAGIDVGVTRKFSVAADLLGARVFSTRRVIPVKFTDRGNFFTGTTHTFDDTFQVQDSINMDDAAVGFKYSPWTRVLVTGNVQLKLNDGGLRAKAIPLVGLSYIF